MYMQSPPLSVMTDDDASNDSSPSPRAEKRRPGRPPTYVFSKPDAELSENERRLKGAVIKRRLRQNRSYHRKKRLKELAQQAAKSAAAAAASSSSDPPVSLPPSSIATSNLPPVNLLAGNLSVGAHFQQATTASPPVLTPLPSLSNSAAMYSNTSIPGTTNDSAVQYFPNVRRDETSRAQLSVSTATSPSVTAELRASSPILSSALDLSASPDQAASTTYFSPSPRFDAGVIQGPTSNVDVRVENSGGIPFLTIGAQRPSPRAQRAAQDGTERDEAQLLEEILEAPSQRGPSGLGSMLPRGGGARSFLNPDLDVRLSTLPKVAAEGLKHLVLFPSSFTAESALDVMGLKPDDNMATEVFKPLVELKLLRVLPSGRYELNAITKGLVANDSFMGVREARQRFVNHFISKLRSLDPDTLSRKGELRLKGMKQYDLESKNIRAALDMCRDIGGRRQTVDLLTHAAAVMRYCTPAYERVELIEQVLNELPPMMSSQQGSSKEKNEARLLLSMSEAYFDLLAYEKGEDYLRRAINMMAGNQRGTFPVSSSVLTLLLLAEVRISNHEYQDSKNVLTEALKSLNEAELQKSTFAVCSFLNLASVYLALKQFENALQTVNTALEVLKELGFSEMPIYADALGTLGAVHLGRGDTEQAQRLFFSALNIFQTWTSKKDWQNAPFQHCTHLDIFLVENIATSYVGQDRHQEAAQLFERARQQRQERRLEVVEAIQFGGGSGSGRLYTRHLY